MRVTALLAAAATCCATISASLADDWVAVRLRGNVLELVDGQWHRLRRGDVVPDDRVIQSKGGRATFVRGEETIELAPNTIQLGIPPNSVGSSLIVRAMRGGHSAHPQQPPGDIAALSRQVRFVESGVELETSRSA